MMRGGERDGDGEIEGIGVGWLVRGR